ncbi:sigma-70 family RNA polymerase sigma factor [Leptospira gomenensis]|uniref:Sigma-70 family RNA polymerase sigma factor n=1 Tax=Leptospira gomenensis TaxID=2484974 RepID=A0A5F1Y5Z5_9LEPT|nr:sigma-70 family RNA polymerase sigma factor [Leptospira gomenensis]TGK28132.1 sigma-70 family RNA polymerase sigma factor [Leptospira gomenensis]TGK37012.1 sigma-70 family RNA polymerase sigma factor [Leptospira gomenensis]TGK45648.1 sigma-70 family RNA polymerase sigma factor [Leptospira gomenensis]TGK59587.1 sigma-70 family RNA polymerase sigma factor [Leptospira gomenensis]
MVESDSTDFSILYEENHRTIYHFLLKISGDPEVAEDLTQEAFLKVFTFYSKFDPERGSFTTWACSIAKNLYFKHYNKQKKEFGNLSIGDSHLEIEVNPEIPENLERAFLEKAIKDSIQSLPEPEKSIILLKELERKTLKETASALGISERTVSRRLISAVALLKEKMESQGLQF